MSKDDDEYTKLYNLLASLSSKTAPRTNQIITPMISLLSDDKPMNKLTIDIPLETLKIDDVPKVEPKVPKVEPARPSTPPLEIERTPTPNIETPVKGSIMESLFGISPIHTPSSEQTDVSIKPREVVEPPKKTEPKEIRGVLCDGCKRTFSCYASLYQHHTVTSMCGFWYSLEDKSEYEVIPPMAVHNLMDEILEKTVAVDGSPFQCRTCRVTFSTKGNLHKHLYNALVCNRVAYARLKKVVAALE